MQYDKLSDIRKVSEQTGLFLDFDGTLSEIVTDPGAARPAEGVQEMLSELARRLALVAVVSGRSAHQLVRWLGSDIEIWGLHGAERAVGGSVEVAESAARYLRLMRQVLDEARERARGPEIVVEDKGVMVALHYRRAEERSEAAREVERVAADLAMQHGLIVGHGRLVVELRPPVEFSKAEVIRRRAGELDLRGAIFAGDDVVDLPGFDALDDLADEGVTTLRVGVASDEAPKELLQRADVVVEGPSGLVGWLRGLLE